MPSGRKAPKGTPVEFTIKIVLGAVAGMLFLIAGADQLDQSFKGFEDKWERQKEEKVVAALAVSHSASEDEQRIADLFPPTAPKTFDQAKRVIYPIFAAHPYDLYCGCAYSAATNQIETGLCGLRTTRWQDRAGRIEAEHVVPASTFGRQRECWRKAPIGVSGRDHCRQVDAMFRYMEADPYNLIPVVGALNAARSNHNMGMVSPKVREFGACDFFVDEARRVAEPPNDAKGDVARIHFYFEDRYGMRLSDQQRRTFLAWHRMDPISTLEADRASKIGARVGWRNEFSEGLKEP